jgi:pimeloyl-ACP methyl ester carboxylesterase
MSTRDFQVGEYTFTTRVAGPEGGPLVVLLHGFPQTSFEWRHQLAALGSAGFRAIAPDQRGYSPGARPPNVSDYVVSELIGDVLGLASAAGAERFFLVGHDWGAAVAWGVALAAPERVRAVVPISVPHPGAFSTLLDDPSSDQFEASAYFDVFVQPSSEDGFLAKDAARLRRAYAALGDEATNEYLRVLGNKPALGAALNWYRANIEQRKFKSMPTAHVRVPTMLVWSDGDEYLRREGAELTARYVDAPYRFEVLEGVDHWVPEVAAERVSALLVEYFGSFVR